MEDKTDEQATEESTENLEADTNKVSDDLAQKPGDEERQESSLLRAVQSFLTFVLGLAGFLTASGFLIVNIYLSRFTDIHVYDVNPGQYLAASIGALTFIILFFIGVIVILFILILIYLLSKGQSWKKRRELLRHALNAKFLQRFGAELQTISTKPAPMLILLFSMIYLSLVYGVIIYPHVPRFLGGGQPVPIGVIFKDPKDIASFGFTSLSSNHPDVVGLGLLAELSDGILVYSVSSGRYAYAAIIKNDQIKGFLDLKNLENFQEYFTAEATETPMPTVQVTATEEATLEP